MYIYLCKRLQIQKLTLLSLVFHRACFVLPQVSYNSLQEFLLTATLTLDNNAFAWYKCVPNHSNL